MYALNLDIAVNDLDISNSFRKISNYLEISLNMYLIPIILAHFIVSADVTRASTIWATSGSLVEHITA